MLGMMNTSTITDNVDVYSSQHRDAVDKSIELKAFVETKKRSTVSYTQDGRRLVDGQLEERRGVEVPEENWGDLLLRTTAKKAMRCKTSDDNGECKEEEATSQESGSELVANSEDDSSSVNLRERAESAKGVESTLNEYEEKTDV